MNALMLCLGLGVIAANSSACRSARTLDCGIGRAQISRQGQPVCAAESHAEMLDCMERDNMLEYANEYRRNVSATFARVVAGASDDDSVLIKYRPGDSSMFHRCAETVAQRHNFAIAMNSNRNEVVAGTVEQVQAKRAWGFMQNSPPPPGSVAQPALSAGDGGINRLKLVPRPKAAPSRAEEGSGEDARD